MSKKPVVLMVLDGYGLNDREEGNAIAMAKTPVMDKLMAECPFVPGQASGLAVGLPDGQMGNSEVGHMNIGAGRIIYQDLTRITKSIEDGDFFENKGLMAAIENCKKNNSDLHMWGLLSDGGVHSHISHVYGLLELAKKNGLSNVYVHAFLDGRDTPPASGKDYVAQLEEKMAEIGVGKIASLSGRYYAMDRDNNWDRVEKAYDSLVKGEGVKATSAVQAMADSYAQDVTDEFVLPTVITDEAGNPLSLVKENDSVQEHFVMIHLQVLTDHLFHLLMFALKIMMRQFQIRLSHLRKSLLQIHLVNILQNVVRSSFVLQRQRSMHM